MCPEELLGLKSWKFHFASLCVSVLMPEYTLYTLNAARLPAGGDRMKLFHGEITVLAFAGANW